MSFQGRRKCLCCGREKVWIFDNKAAVCAYCRKKWAEMHPGIHYDSKGKMWLMDRDSWIHHRKSAYTVASNGNMKEARRWLLLAKGGSRRRISRMDITLRYISIHPYTAAWLGWSNHCGAGSCGVLGPLRGLRYRDESIPKTHKATSY